MAVVNQNGKWRVDFIWKPPIGEKERIRKVSPVQTEAGAHSYELELKSKLWESGLGHLKKSKPTLNDVFPSYLLSIEDEGLKPLTRRNKAQNIRLHIGPSIGKVRVDQISANVIDTLVSWCRKKELGLETRKLVLRTLKRILFWCVERDYIERRDIPKFPKLGGLLGSGSVKNQRISDEKWLTFGELDGLVSGVSGRERLVVLLGCDAGLRRAEICGLKWRDIDFKNRSLSISRAKNDKGETVDLKTVTSTRILSLTDRLHDALKAYQNGTEDGFIFPKLVGYGVWEIVRAASKSAGMRKATPHMLRHTFCSHLSIKGVSIQAIQKAAGHASIDVTLQYAHLNNQAIADAIAALGR